MTDEPEYTYEFRQVSWAIIIVSYLPLFGMGALALYGVFASVRFDKFADWAVTIFFIFGLLYAFHRFVHILSTANRVDFFQDHLETKGLLFKRQVTYKDVLCLKKSNIRPNSVDLIYNKNDRRKSFNIAMEFDKNVELEMDYAQKFLNILYEKTEPYSKIDKEDIDKLLKNKSSDLIK